MENILLLLIVMLIIYYLFSDKENFYNLYKYSRYYYPRRYNVPYLSWYYPSYNPWNNPEYYNSHWLAGSYLDYLYGQVAFITYADDKEKRIVLDGYRLTIYPEAKIKEITVGYMADIVAFDKDRKIIASNCYNINGYKTCKINDYVSEISFFNYY